MVAFGRLCGKRDSGVKSMVVLFVKFLYVRICVQQFCFSPFEACFGAKEINDMKCRFYGWHRNEEVIGRI